MAKTFFIGDTHFGHTNVLKYDSRPFESIEEHDKALIRIWNETVNPDDTVWFLGDLVFSKSAEETREIVSKLNGHKRMVMGNHDRKSVDFYLSCGFERVYDHPVIVRRFFILSHEPMFMTPDMPYMNIYAHVHNHPAYKDYEPEKALCVSCCRWDYRPIECREWNLYNPADHPKMEAY